MRKVLIFITLFFLFLAGNSLAKSDLSLNVSDITFSKEQPLAGEKVRVFGRVFNVGDEDVYGFVIFSINGKDIGEPQPISVKAGTYDDVFVDWVFQQGNNNVQAKIVATQPVDEDSTNDLAVQENYFVDLNKNLDTDNDGLTDETEKTLGTDPANPDSDGDQIIDSQDNFPLDKNESQDTDNDGLGDNVDTDDDNDTLSDEEELALGIDPLKTDTDGDLIPDKVELKIGFLKPNRNEWDVAKWGLASVVAVVKSQVAEGNLLIGQLFATFGFLAIFWLILRYIEQKKKQE